MPLLKRYYNVSHWQESMGGTLLEVVADGDDVVDRCSRRRRRARLLMHDQVNLLWADHACRHCVDMCVDVCVDICVHRCEHLCKWVCNPGRYDQATCIHINGYAQTKCARMRMCRHGLVLAPVHLSVHTHRHGQVSARGCSMVTGRLLSEHSTWV